MNRLAVLLVLLSILCLVVTACEWNPFGIPREVEIGFEIETTSELGPETLHRIDKVNRTLERGVEVGPETRALIDEINRTIREGAKVGFDGPTLQRIDRLLRVIEDGVGFEVGPETLERIDDLIDSIDRAPDQWERSVTEIIKTLEGSAGSVAGQMASEIKMLMKEARLNSQELIATGGVEFRCNADFLQSRLRLTVDELIGRSLIGRLRAIIAPEEIEPAIPTPWVCQIIPDQIDLAKIGEKLVSKEAIIRITGYDYVDGNLPEVYVEDKNRQKVDSIELSPRRTSFYQIQLNLQEIDFSTVPANSWVVFRWPDVGKHSIAILLPETVRQPELVIDAPRADVYEGPGTGYRRIGIAEQGALYVVTGRNGDSTWWQINYDGEIGWVSNDLVTRNDIPVSVAQNIPLPKPTADFEAEPREGEASLIVQFWDRSSGEPDARFWEFGDGATSTEPNPAHTYDTSGQYSVRLTVSNTRDSDTKAVKDYIEVFPPRPTADFEAEPREGEPSLIVQFWDRSSGEPDAWFWEFGDGATSTEPNPAHTYNTSGQYSVRLTVSNTRGSDTRAVKDYIEVFPPRPTADFEAEPREGEPSLIVQFWDRSSGEPDARFWEFGDGAASTEPNPTHAYNRAGRYDVRLTVTNARGSDSKTERAYIIVELPSCTKPLRTIAASEETGPVVCPSSYVLKGIKCKGAFCDNKELLCCPYRHGEDNSAQRDLSPLISEEKKPREQFSYPHGNEYIQKSGFVYGIWCFHNYCDNIRMHIITTPSLRNTGLCSFMPEVSEEGSGEAKCEDGWYVAGMKCRGDNCDNVSLYCCKAE